MRRSLLHYDLPEELIASHPTDDREAARLLVVHPDNLDHRSIRDLPDLLPEGSLVVVNDTRVLRARLLGKKLDSGGKVEIFLVRRLGRTTVLHDAQSYEAETWLALGKSSKPLRPGALVAFGDGPMLLAKMGERSADGTLEVTLFAPTNLPLADAIDAVGHVAFLRLRFVKTTTREAEELY